MWLSANQRGNDINRLIGVAFVVVSSIAYGAMPIFARLAYADGAATTTVLFLRFTLAGGLLLVYMLASGTPFPRGRTLLSLALLGIFGYVGQSLAYFTALSLAPASLVVLLLYLSPVIVMVGSFFFFRERVTRTKVFALTLALAGAVVMISQSSSSGNPGHTTGLGIALGLFAATVGAIYVLAGSRVLRTIPTVPAMTVIISSTGAAYAIIAAAQGFHFPAHLHGYAAILGLATISTVVAIGAFLAGLQRVGPSNASTLGVLEPVTTVALAALILGETLRFEQIVGGILIGAAVVMISRAA